MKSKDTKIQLIISLHTVENSVVEMDYQRAGVFTDTVAAGRQGPAADERFDIPP